MDIDRETGVHNCEEADEPMEGMKVFYLVKLAVNDEGDIRGGLHYHGSELADVPESVGRLCKAVANALARELPDILEQAYFAEGLQAVFEQAVQGTKEKSEENNDDNQDSESDSSRQSTEIPGIPGDLKQHGRIVH